MVPFLGMRPSAASAIAPRDARAGNDPPPRVSEPISASRGPDRGSEHADHKRNSGVRALIRGVYVHARAG